jgi:hypothetical protein
MQMPNPQFVVTSCAIRAHALRAIRLTNEPMPGTVDAFSYGPHLAGDRTVTALPPDATTDAERERP